MDKALFRQVHRVDDCPILWEIFQKESAEGRPARCRPTADGGFKVTDPTLWDEVLVRMEQEAAALRAPGAAVFLEFARPNYLDSLRNFSKETIRRARLVYVECSFDTCWRRNLARYEAPAGGGHLVSREEMEATYRLDDRDALIAGSPCPAVTVDNETDGEDRLWKAVDAVIEFLRA